MVIGPQKVFKLVTAVISEVQFIALHFIIPLQILPFKNKQTNKLKVGGNPASSKLIYWCHFPNSNHSVHVSVSILAILTIFWIFSSLLYLLWCVIFDITIEIILGHHKLHPCKTVNLLNKHVRSDRATVPLSLFSPWASLFPETQYWNQAN